MDYTKSLCMDKLDLILDMVLHNDLTPEEVKFIWKKLNDVSHDIDEYINKRGVRDRRKNP